MKKVICPTVTAVNVHQYREQMERLAPFATRVHLDFMDGKFTAAKSPDIKEAWWPHSMHVDFHLMFRRPNEYIDEIIKLCPRLVIVHAEAEGNFIELARRLHDNRIMTGLALLQDTDPEVIKPALEHIDHILVFSGHLGYFGGKTDLKLLDKVQRVKNWKPSLEIGWDGGINDRNAAQLAAGGVDVLNVGGFIQHAADPRQAYAKLEEIIKP